MVNKTEYNRIHKWAERNMLKIGQCFYCDKVGKTQWSNIDHSYREVKDEWQEVCIKCHEAFDRLMNGKHSSPGRPRTKPQKLRTRRVNKVERRLIGSNVIMHSVLSDMRLRG
jgi:hypothetical protein